MASTQSTVRRINHVDESLLGKDAIEFLHNLQGPSWIEIPGKNMTSRRVVVTLLHGNEPSGLKAVHTLLKQKIVPATQLGIMIASVDAASYNPSFSHRYIPGERDLNRCFTPPYPDNQSRLAENILELLHRFEPEAVIDTHNTSSHSEPFCVAVNENVPTLELASLFADSLIVLDQSLGTLLEQVNQNIPTVTVEFGGFMDPNADSLALKTLRHFITADTVSGHDISSLRMLTEPLRLETEHHLTVTYSASIDEQADLTIINTIDQLNFRTVAPGTILGWFAPHQHQNLVARDKNGTDMFGVYFDQTDGLLRTRESMTIFMATTDPGVANNDCLLYFTLNTY
jgi:hypothetical protein